MLALLERLGPRENAGVFHSFTESARFGRQVIDLGFRVSFSGMITFRSADNIREAAAGLPLDALLIETDSPYLAPEPHRGKRCEPAFVVETAKRLAEVQRVTVERVAEATTASFERLFPRRSAG
jgi:TatD DNase family protein